MNKEIVKKSRILCLHGYGLNGKALETQMQAWPEFVLEKMDLVYINGPFLVDLEPQYFDPPYFYWFQYDWDLKEYKNFDKTLAYIEDRMIELGPFDGVLGFSQGAILTAALPGIQMQGVALTKVPKIKFVIIMSGFKFGGKTFAAPEQAKDVFSSPIDIPSLHTIGMKEGGLEDHFDLVKSYVDPVLFFHHEGHVVPHLGEIGLKLVLGFLDKIESLLKRRIYISSSNESKL